MIKATAKGSKIVLIRSITDPAGGGADIKYLADLTLVEAERLINEIKEAIAVTTKAENLRNLEELARAEKQLQDARQHVEMIRKRVERNQQ
jgi:hypothetical protein